jgi:hypothetical protein
MSVRSTGDIMNAMYTPYGGAPSKQMPAPIPGKKGKYRNFGAPRSVGDRITGTYADGSFAALEAFDRKGSLYWRVQKNKSGGHAGARKGQGNAAGRSFVSDLIQQNNGGKGISTQSPVKLANVASEAIKIWASSVAGSHFYNNKTEVWNAFTGVLRSNPRAGYNAYIAPVLRAYAGQIVYGAPSVKSGSAIDQLLASKPKRSAAAVSPVRMPSGSKQSVIDYYRNYSNAGAAVPLNTQGMSKSQARRARQLNEQQLATTSTDQGL